MAREANSKPPLLIPGKEEGIKSLWGVSSDSIAISGVEMQEDSLYQKPSVWLYNSSPGISIYLSAKYYFYYIKE